MMHEVWKVPPGTPGREMRRPDVSRIFPGLLIGEYPLPGDMRWLVSQHGVSTIVNLQDAHDLGALRLDLRDLRDAAAECGVTYHHFPVPDCRPDDLRHVLHDILATLADAEARGQVTFLHCNAGLNRAPTAAIAYVHARAGMSLAAACALVKSRRACGPYMRVLEAFFAA
jgi:protein-tyrosine phosphatase